MSDDFLEQLLDALLNRRGVDTSVPGNRRKMKQLLQQRAVQHLLRQCHHVLNSVLVSHGTGGDVKIKPAQLQPSGNKSLPTRMVKLRTANVTMGQSFCQTIDLLEDLRGDLILHDIRGDYPGQLCCDVESMQIQGKLDQAGDWQIELLGMLLRPDGVQQPVCGQLKVTVIADPRSLWQVHPSDPKARFYKPDQDVITVSHPDLLLMGASIRGRAHAHKGTLRDDDVAIAYSEGDDWVILAVADGAGSCRYSRRGAQLAVSVSTQSLLASLNGDEGEQLQQAVLADQSDRLNHLYQRTIVKAAFDALCAIEQQAADHPEDQIGDFSTTLLLAAVKPLSDQTFLVLTLQIGDGVTAVRCAESSVNVLGQADHGEFAGQTRFLDRQMFEDGSIYQRVTVQQIHKLQGFVMMTDGVSDPWFETEEMLHQPESWLKLWQQLQPIAVDLDQPALLEWLQFWSPGYHDDRSLVMLMNRSMNDKTAGNA